MSGIYVVQNDPNPRMTRLTITSLMTAAKNNQIDLVKNSLSHYGLPKSATKTTDYLILQTALIKNHTEIAKLLINAGCRLNKLNNEVGYTPLAYAILLENEELATLLLAKGASLDAGDGNGLTVFHLAAKNKSLKMLQFLLRCGMSVNHVSNGKTALQVFLESSQSHNFYDQKNTEILKLFLKMGASTNFKLTYGQTILHHVVSAQQYDLIRSVLQVTNNVNEQDQSRNTALHYLLQHNKSDQNIAEIVKLFISKGATVDIQNSSGDTALHLAAKNKQLQILHIFMQCQWNVNCFNNKNNTVLNCILLNSASFAKNEQYIQIVDYILRHRPLSLIKNNQDESPLYIAAANKQTKVLKIFLPMLVDIRPCDKNGISILFVYITKLIESHTPPDKDDIEVVKMMISKGANPFSIINQTKYTPMHFALRLKNKEFIWSLLEPCSIDADNLNLLEKRSILHLLCYYENDVTEAQELAMAEIAEMCIEKKGANVNAKDGESKTPLYYAVLMRQKHMVKILLEHGADPNVKDNEGRTILENLMKKEVILVVPDYGRNNVSDMFEQHVMKQIPQDIEKDSEIAQMLFAKNATVDQLSNCQYSLLHHWAQSSQLDMLQIVIPNCKDVNIRNSQGDTLLHTLLTHNLNTNEEIEKKVAKIVAMLLGKKAEVNAVNKKNETPLHLAIKGKHLESTKIFLQFNSRFTDLDSNGNSILHLLCMVQPKVDGSVEKDLAALLISQGCNVNARNNNGMTPLLLAAECGLVNMIEILVKSGADVNCTKDKDLSTPIHLATIHNHPEMIMELARYQVDLNAKRRDRKTALHLSIDQKVNYEVTMQLLKCGADTDLKDDNGRTPLHWACWYESFEKVCVLLKYGADVNAMDNAKATPLMLSQIQNTWNTLYFHVIRLKSANMPVSKRNQNCIQKYTQRHPDYEIHNGSLENLKKLAVQELLQIKNIMISVRMTLADVFKIPVNKLFILKSNEDFQKLINSDDFEKKYPVFADLIKARYLKAIIRCKIMSSAKDAFRKMIGLALPDTCCDAIFQDLDNDNLQDLIEASKIKIIERERFMNEVVQNIPGNRKKNKRIN